MSKAITYTIRVADENFRNSEVRKSIQLLSNTGCDAPIAYAITTIRLQKAHEICDELIETVEYALAQATNENDKELYTKILDKIYGKKESEFISEMTATPSISS